MMTDEELLEAAKSEVSDLVDDVIEQVYDLADLCHYEPSWVMEEFKKRIARECDKRGI